MGCITELKDADDRILSIYFDCSNSSKAIGVVNIVEKIIE